MAEPTRRIAIAATLVTGTSAAAWEAWRVLGGEARQLVASACDGTIAGWPLDRVVGGAAAVLAIGALAGASGALLLAITEAALGSRSPALLARITPYAARRLVAACCGVGLTAGVVGGGLMAPADASPGRDPCPACAPAPPRLTGLPLPALPFGSGTVTHRATASQAPRTVVVRSGDSLWSIAERLLPPSASPSRIAALVDRLYAQNRTEIGADPNLIFPGTLLTFKEDAHDG